MMMSDIPLALREGENWELLDLDKDWIWLAKEDDEVVGFLMACNCHGLVLLWRLKMLPSADPSSLLKLLRRFIRDIRKRGALGYMLMLDATRAEEQALVRIAFRAKALVAPGCYSLIVGTVNTGHLGETCRS